MPSSPPVSLSVEGIVNAEKTISCYEQRQYFKEEIVSLEKGKQCNRGSSLYKLDPFMDFWIMRVGGRTRKMAMTIEVKHPMTFSRFKANTEPHPPTGWSLWKRSHALHFISGIGCLVLTL